MVHHVMQGVVPAAFSATMMNQKIYAAKGGYIPVPATSAAPPHASRKITVRWVMVSAIALAVHLLRPVTFVDHHKHKPLVGRAAEELYLSVPDETSCTETSRHFTAKPHPAGSANDKTTAIDFLHLLQTELGIPSPEEEPIFAAGSPESQHSIWGILNAHKPYAWIDEYYPVMNTPLDRAVQVLDAEGNVVWDADLTEHTDNTDPEAGKYYDAVPTFHGLSKGGDVTGKLIYANYGMKEDFDALLADGVNMTGSIILARYGMNFRGLKVKGAEEVGAVGILIYSDIRDDGPVTEENGYEAYPHGPARSPTSVQRGSVQFLSMYPGDPTTPGLPAYANASRTDGLNIPAIPSLPFSSANAAKLLELVKDGALVRLKNNVDTRVMPIWNTMAVIPGYITDEVLVVGNHRDAWVMGATDPTSGTATIAETIRGFGALLKKGWKPLRTIVFASWDAEEYGLIGSTEWGEDFPEFIDKHVFAYLNLDSAAVGSRWSASGSPLLAHFIKQTAMEIPHPTDKGRTLWDARSDIGPFIGDGQVVKQDDSEGKDSERPEIGVLGSGSDFTIFLQRIGVASSDGSFGSSASDAVYHYHSVYDSEYWMEKYGDPGFYRHVAVAKHLGLQMLRLSNNLVLPFNTTYYAHELERYLDEVENLDPFNSLNVDFAPLRSSMHTLQAVSLSLDYEKFVAENELVSVIKKWKKASGKLQKIKRKLRKVMCKIRAKLGHPCEDDMELQSDKEDMAMLYGFALQAGLEPRACSMDGRVPKLPLFEMRKAVKRVRVVNEKLASFERGLISEDGIPEREWYKHLGVAPGKWLGYGATTLPALTEAITEEGNSTLAQYEAGRLKVLIDILAENLRV